MFGASRGVFRFRRGRFFGWFGLQGQQAIERFGDDLRLADEWRAIVLSVRCRRCPLGWSMERCAARSPEYYWVFVLISVDWMTGKNRSLRKGRTRRDLLWLQDPG